MSYEALRVKAGVVERRKPREAVDVVVGAKKVVSGARAKEMSRITRLSRTVTVTRWCHEGVTVARAPPLSLLG